MDAEVLFLICNRAVLPAWLLLLFAPKWHWTHKLVFHAWIPSLLALCYIYAFIRAEPFPPEANFSTLSGVLIFFQLPYVALAGWVHYLAFDLFVGSWILRDGQRRGIHHLLLTPCLVMTLLLGPIGLLLYFMVRFVLTKALTTQEHDQLCAQ